MRRFRVLALIACSLVLALVGCRKKEPYPSAPFEDKDTQRVAQPETPSLPPISPIAAIVTPEGSFLVTGRKNGEDLDVRRLPDLVHITTSGEIVRLRITTESSQSRKFQFQNLVLLAGKEERIMFPTEPRPDFGALPKADPDLSKLFYHRETIHPLGALEGKFSFLVKTEGFLGGAHPYSNVELVTVDAETKSLVQSDSTPPKEVSDLLDRLGPEECVRHFKGIFAAQEVGGSPSHFALLTHEYEVCRGKFKLLRLGQKVSQKEGAKVTFSGSTLEVLGDSGTLRFEGVQDFRVSDDGSVIIMVMALGKGDRLPSLDESDPSRWRSRELRLFMRGMKEPLVLGRTTRLLDVQFLLGREEVLQALPQG